MSIFKKGDLMMTQKGSEYVDKSILNGNRKNPNLNLIPAIMQKK